MGFGWGFMLLLMVVGGFAAYQGDSVGMMVGKRRLSILGMRPRYSSRIITVLTGVLIVLFTLVSLILLSENVRQALFGLEELQESVAVLSGEVGVKNAELASLETQRRSLSNDIARLDEENLYLQGQNADLRKEKEILTRRNADLQAEQLKLEADQTFLVNQLDELRRAGQYYFDQVSRLQQANFDLRQTSFVYHALDVIASAVVDAHLSPERLRSELKELVAEANAQVLLTGGGDPETNIGVRIDRVLVSGENQYTPVGADMVIDLAVDAIQSDDTVTSVIVQLVAITNAAAGEPVQADFGLIRNMKLFDAGDVVATHVFDGRRSRSRIFEEFIVWMQDEIRQVAMMRGLMPQGDGTFGGVRPGQVYEAVDLIAAFGSSVELVAYAQHECWTQGPLELGFGLRPIAVLGGIERE